MWTLRIAITLFSAWGGENVTLSVELKDEFRTFSACEAVRVGHEDYLAHSIANGSLVWIFPSITRVITKGECIPGTPIPFQQYYGGVPT